MKNLVIAILVLFIIQISSLAQENLTYQKPSKEILELADYERAPNVTIDSKKEYMILTYRNTYKSLEELNQEEMRLGGLRINPITNITSGVNYINNIKIRKVKDDNVIQVKGLPANPQLTNFSLSPNEKKLAFTNTTNKGVELWVIDISTATAKKLTEPIINSNLNSPINWFGDNENLLVRILPKKRPSLLDEKKDIPSGPIVSVSDGSKSQNRTYQDLLKNKRDESNFEILVTSELHKVSINGKSNLFKESAFYAGESFSPDGKYVLITTIEKPFSYIVPWQRFPLTTSVYDNAGKFVKKINELPLNEITPKGFMAVRPGKRNMSWRNDKKATLFYVEALDGGDPAAKVNYRDELFQWEAPFNSTPLSIIKLKQRFRDIIWGDEKRAIVTDQWYDTRNVKTYLIDPSIENISPVVLADRNSQDIYSDPGKFELKRNDFGRNVLAIENNHAILIGEGFTKEGQFPFIDELNLTSLEKKRLYQSNLNDKMERLISFVDIQKGDLLVLIQSKNEFPNYYIRNIKEKSLNQLTHFQNPFVSLQNVHKEVIKYFRKDGVELSGTLYLPADYDKSKKDKLSLLIWAYPQEFKDKNSAGQTSANPNEFTYPNYGSFVYWVAKGYAVLDDASFPIVGEGTEEPNDTFIKQLVDNAEAAINAINNLGYIDRNKVAIGGHSYGAFMTANLLTHSNLFACGVARSGAYNRTLTPFGFQREQRNYWEVPHIYNQMSPFMNAEKVKTPILLIHGEADNNPGTFTLQTERYFGALKGLGAEVRMVILPKESHGYAAKENILHLLWEQDQFFEKYLK
jgi:dipeptidyl aminopeptidase/acylaminoacyl peptidase